MSNPTSRKNKVEVGVEVEAIVKRRRKKMKMTYLNHLRGDVAELSNDYDIY